jgi:predicted GH43/DUF377 family glycosyl hydrolase/tetratricopeptide (TPR) repeat protein
MSSAAGQSIGLCMMVRNEAEIVERCLASVAGIVDSWVICDTGSTDGTRERIAGALHGVPGELHETPWVDFGHNRTLLLDLARDSADYLLLLDADMTVRGVEGVPRLTEDAYLLRETGVLDYGVLRLIRGDRRWWYEGSTHEYLATDGRFSQAELGELVVEHHADGSARPEKLIRDVGLLKRDLARDPSSARSTFYLAQTYRDLGKKELAIEHYRRRVELGGWDQEVFYANLQEGLLRAEDDPDAALGVLLEAWDRRPSRAEPLHALARAAARLGRHESAHMFASRGLEIPYPADVLFIHRWVYRWGLRLERAHALGRLGRADEAREDFAALLEGDELPRDVEEYARLYLAELQPGGRARRIAPSSSARLDELVPGARVGEVVLDVRPAWPAFNPSITSASDGLQMIVRTANYRLGKGILHTEGVLHNLNYLVDLGPDLAVTRIRPLADRAEDAERFESEIDGYEDCRLIEVGGQWFATATVADLNPDERREVALLTLDDGAVTAVRPLRGPHPGRHEKNWMPFVRDGALHLVYSCGPTVVLRCDTATGELEVVSESTAPPEAEAFRGGSQGVEVDGGLLFVVHEVRRAPRSLLYLHRFVMLDDDLRLASASPPFTFTQDHVEFCAGMARHGDELVLSFGVSDAAAGLAVVPLAGVVALLDPVWHADRHPRQDESD